MFTKTGLRPREITGRGANRTNAASTGGHHDMGSTSLGPPLPGSWKKLPPITATGRHDDSYGSGLSATRRAEHPATGASFEPASGVAGRRGTARPGRSAPSSSQGRGGVPVGSTARKKVRARGRSTGRQVESFRRGGGGGGGSGDGRSRSAGRRAGVSASAAVPARRPTPRTRPEWDDSLRDPSQYRLTPDEALRRKVALVSKHNTLVFGLGGSSSSGSIGSSGSSPKKAMSGSPPSNVVATDVTRGRGAKQQQQEQNQESRKSRAGSAVSADEKGHPSRRQLRHCRSASRVSTIYGGGSGGSGGGVVRKPGEAAVEPSAPATPDGDLTAAGIEEAGELAEGVGMDDVTMTVYAGGGSGAGGNDGGGDDDSTRAAAAAASQGRDTPSSSDCTNRGDGRGGGGSGADDGGGEGQSTLGLGGGGGKGGGCRRLVGGAETGLAGIKAGLRAFSERVGRLETFGMAGTEQRSTAGEGQQAGRAGEDLDQQDDVSTGLAGGAEAAAASGERMCRSPGRRHAAAAHDSDHISADTGLDAGKERGPLSHANPWDYHHAGSLSSSSLPFHKQGGRDELGLTERIHLLEAQVFPASSPPSPPPPSAAATAAAETDAAVSDLTNEALSDNGGVRTAAVFQQGRERPQAAAAVRGGDARRGTEPSAREKRMRAIIGDLASLSAALLERLVTAEGRLQNAAAAGGGVHGNDGGRVGGSGGVGGTDMFFQKARLMVAQAEAFLVLASPGDDDAATAPRPAPPPPLTTTQEQQGEKPVAASAGAAATGTTASALALPEGGAAPLRSGQSTVIPAPLPPPPPRQVVVPPCPAPKDCWGEALDDLGRLVDGPPLLGGFRGDGRDGVVAAKPSGTSGAPAKPSSPHPPPSAAVAAMPLSGRANGGDSPLVFRRLRRPPPPQQAPPPLGAATTCVPRAGAPRWENPRQQAPPVPTSAGEDYSGGAAAGFAVFSRRPVVSAAVGHEEEEEEEDVCAALPVASAPTPSKKPRHPFGGQGSSGSSSSSSPPMRSPRWLRDHVGNAHAEAVPGSGPWDGFPPLSASSSGRRGVGANAREHSVGGGGGRDEAENAPPPPIGQWYTPPLHQP